MNTETCVYVDPACNINYASFYIIGLREIFGFWNIKFSSKPFKTLHYTIETHIFAFVVNDKKFIIDFADSNLWFYDDFLEWADIYGKVNYHKQHIPQKWKTKIVKVGANFGIPCYGTNMGLAILWSLYHYSLCFNRISYGFKGLLTSYLTLYKRKQSRKTDTHVSNPPLVCFISRYWKGQFEANENRIKFIRACKQLEKEGAIRFLGGLIPNENETDERCPQEMMLTKEIPHADYLTYMQESILVFNTPAYYGCHGWKLPEYLSLGKVILSTPFVNELAIPLENKRNIYFCESSEESIYQSISNILKDSLLQQQLKEGALNYWDLYGSPKACINRFIRCL